MQLFCPLGGNSVHVHNSYCTHSICRGVTRASWSEVIDLSYLSVFVGTLFYRSRGGCTMGWKSPLRQKSISSTIYERNGKLITITAASGRTISAGSQHSVEKWHIPRAS